ncbi:MAG: hypothetical protein RIM83_16345 [Allomuricauda sp.]|jgi:hypothetical protein|uniref:hypothetical protein n=1 Tax=Allomuricauda sp. CP2A TaxID=1848189 RepID=UPI001146489B|nr:hypothetical protein [Muricauda sp. CP2A]
MIKKTAIGIIKTLILNLFARSSKTTGPILYIILLGMSVNSCNSKNEKANDADSEEVYSHNWIMPNVEGGGCIPVWGHYDGIRIGLPPTGGPRGLLRVYAPYLNLSTDSLKMINFIALEPIVSGSDSRGFSELEPSALDNVRGKRFWSANEPDAIEPRSIQDCATGVIEQINGRETLTLYVHSEEFDSGAKVYVRVRFYEDRPYEIELTSYAAEKSAPLDNFILTATMGNFARLRNLYLKGGIKSSWKLWPDYTDSNFTPHDHTPESNMLEDKDGSVYFVAAPDEEDPTAVTYSLDTKEHWKYKGQKATQYWKKPNPNSNLNGLVNGRYAYWASESPIPGGISYENFEMKEPFENGSMFYFGVSPLDPETFIGSIEK